MVDRYDAGVVEDYLTELLFKNGVPETKARVTAHVITWSDMSGIFSHGINNIGDLVIDSIRKRGTLPNAQFVDVTPTEHEHLGIRHIDANGDLGPPVAMYACELVRELAEKHGGGKVTVFNANHFGPAAIYSEKIAKDGKFSGFVTCTTPSVVIPYGGNKNGLGTNPMAWSISYGKNIVTIDMSTTVHAASGIVKAYKAGAMFPFPVIKDGNLTRNPNDFRDLADLLNNASIPSLGSLGVGHGKRGDSGFKGSGLGTLIFLMNIAGGGPKGYIDPMKHDESRRISQTFDAWRIDTLYGKRTIDQITQGVEYLRSCGSGDMFLAGEIEHRTYQDSEENGILYETIDIDRLEVLATAAGMPRLRPMEKA